MSNLTQCSMCIKVHNLICLQLNKRRLGGVMGDGKVWKYPHFLVSCRSWLRCLQWKGLVCGQLGDFIMGIHHLPGRSNGPWWNMSHFQQKKLYVKKSKQTTPGPILPPRRDGSLWGNSYQTRTTKIAFCVGSLKLPKRRPLLILHANL